MSTSPTPIPEQSQLSHVKDTYTENNLSHWIFERVQPFITGRVLEIHNDYGNTAALCRQNNIPAEVLSLNLANEAFDINNNNLANTFDTVIALNSAEQIVNNSRCVANSTKLLKKEGHLLTLLPACTALYNGLDQGLTDWLKSNQLHINKLLRTNYKIVKVRYFFLGDLSNEDNKNLPLQIETKYQKHVPVFKMPEKTTFNITGLSIIVVARKR